MASAVSFAQAQDSLYARKRQMVGYTDGYRVYSAAHKPLTELAPDGQGAGGAVLVRLPKAKKQYYLVHLDGQGKATGTQLLAVRGDSVAVLRGYAAFDSTFRIDLVRQGERWQARLTQLGRLTDIDLPNLRNERLQTLLNSRMTAFDGQLSAQVSGIQGRLAGATAPLTDAQRRVETETGEVRERIDAQSRRVREARGRADDLRRQGETLDDELKQQARELPSRAVSDAKAVGLSLVAQGRSRALGLLASLPRLPMRVNQLPAWATIDSARRALPLPDAPPLPDVSSLAQSSAAEMDGFAAFGASQPAGQTVTSRPTLPYGPASAPSVGTGAASAAPSNPVSPAPASAFVPGPGARTAAVWAFGEGGGVQFRPDGIRVFSGASLQQLEGSASLADSNGNLLAYTDGKRLWDAQNNLITDRLSGHASTTQGALFAPVPGTTDQFWLFTLDQGGYMGPSKGLYATQVQLSNRRGRLLNDPVQLDGQMTEKLTAIAHPDGQSVWVVGHRAFSNEFVAWQVTANGIAGPVVSAVGSHHSGFGNGTIGQMKLSPDGRQLAVAITGESRIELFGFDIETGQVHTPIPLPELGRVPQAYGVEFSPNGHYLYATGWYDNTVRRFDPQDTLAPVVELIPPDGVGLTCNALQLAPDGQIYIALMDGPAGVGAAYLGRIAHPDRGGVVQLQAVPLATGSRSRFGLPAFLASAVAPPKLDFVPDNLCAGLPVTFLNRSTGIDSTTRWFWRFGDGAFSAWPSPQHRYTHAGTYRVELVRMQGMRRDSIWRMVTVSTPPIVELGPNRTLPADGAALSIGPLEAEDGVLYRWNTGESMSAIDVSTPGTYVLHGRRSSCICRDSLTILPTYSDDYLDFRFTGNFNDVSFRNHNQAISYSNRTERQMLRFNFSLSLPLSFPQQQFNFHGSTNSLNRGY